MSQSPDSSKQAPAPAAWSEKYDHQHPYFLDSRAKKPCVVEGEGMRKDKRDASAKLRKIKSENDGGSLTQSPPSRKVAQSGRTIWSITPEELSELAKDMADMKKEPTEPTKKVSYAEASKRSLPGSALSRAAQMKGVAVEQPIRTFKKYYGLPNIPSFEPLHSDAEASKEKATPFEKFADAEVDNKPMDYSQIFGLSATTPTFYPRQTTDTNELIQMLKASLASKKVAPHMDWWPGDWKCTNCGNHNFSYRDTCKRCRVGRLEDAGFVFPTSSVDSSS